MLSQKSRLDVVLGGQAGSEGKGKFAGYLALKDDYDMAISNFMPNAGHTWVSDKGEKVLVQQIPQSVVNKNTKLMISAGSAIEVDVLVNELNKYNAWERTFIHPRAVIIEEKHRKREAEGLERISSTLKGCGEALADKVRRKEGTKLAGDLEPDHILFDLVCSQQDFEDKIHHSIDLEEKIMVECPQGYDLDINHGLEYPYCTSRQTITSQALADAGMPPQLIGEVIAVIRPYPIRVGDAYNDDGVKVGTSGTYLDSKEISWDIVAERSGTPRDKIKELTTVTKKVRRVFEPNYNRLRQMVRTNGVTQIALNFANYIDYEVYGVNKKEDITQKVWDFIDRMERELGVPVTLIGTGEKNSHIVDLRTQPYYPNK